MRAFYHHYPEGFQWKKPPYEYEAKKMPIDILAGSDTLRLQIEGGCTLGEIAASWEEQLEGFLVRRKPYLLY